MSSSVVYLLYWNVSQNICFMLRLIRRNMNMKQKCKISVIKPGIVETLDIVFDDTDKAFRYGRNLMHQHICDNFVIVKG